MFTALEIEQLSNEFETKTPQEIIKWAVDTFWPQIVSTSLTGLRIPLAAWWSRAFGLLGIWVALSATAIARGVAMILFWRSGRWRTAKV